MFGRGLPLGRKMKAASIAWMQSYICKEGIKKPACFVAVAGLTSKLPQSLQAFSLFTFHHTFLLIFQIFFVTLILPLLSPITMTDATELIPSPSVYISIWVPGPVPAK